MSRYFVRPKADQDLGDQAYYYGSEVSAELGHRFLIAAHDTFALLASSHKWGGVVDSDILASNRFAHFG